jgi:hypothetical protein
MRSTSAVPELAAIGRRSRNFPMVVPRGSGMTDDPGIQIRDAQVRAITSSPQGNLWKCPGTYAIYDAPL